MMNNDIGTVIKKSDANYAQVEQRRQKLMAARSTAIARGDWSAMNDITRRLAKLPVKSVR